jgi:hypothetical protein
VHQICAPDATPDRAPSKPYIVYVGGHNALGVSGGSSYPAPYTVLTKVANTTELEMSVMTPGLAPYT